MGYLGYIQAKGMDINILFGVTSGLLSLVGLIAIFVSINTQHSVEKAREVLWSLQSFYFDYKELGDDSHKKLSWYYNHYRNLTKMQFNLSRFFVSSLACVTIFLVACSWLYYTLRADYTWKVNVFIITSCVILILFIALLFWLTMVPKVGSLPTHEELFNVKFNEKSLEDNSEEKVSTVYGLNMHKLFLQHIKFNMDGLVILGNDGCRLALDFKFKLPFPIANSNIMLTFHARNNEGEKVEYGIKDPEIKGTLVCFGWNSDYLLNQEEMSNLEAYYLNEDFYKFGRIVLPYYVTLTINGMLSTFRLDSEATRIEEFTTTVLDGYNICSEGYTKDYTYHNIDRNEKISWIENSDNNEFEFNEFENII